MKEVDILIPLGKSKIDHLDLRYVLRSIEKHVMGYREIVIVGEKPDWIQGVIHIPYEDDPDKRWKERNIYMKTMVACLRTNLTENLFATNDDIFIIKDIDATKYPFYYKGSCEEAWIANTSTYRATMNHGRKFLTSRGFEDINADTHTPIIYNKKEFLNTFEEELWLTGWGYPIKSLYCAVNRKPMVFLKDCKLTKKYTPELIEERVKDLHVFSCDDTAMKHGLGEWLQNRFPEKSSYEKQ